MTTVFVWNRKFHTLNGTCWIELNQQKATNSFFPCNNLSVIFGWTSSHRQNVHQRANVHLFPVGHSRCNNVTHNILRQLQVKLLFSVVVICCCCCISFIGVFFFGRIHLKVDEEQVLSSKYQELGFIYAHIQCTVTHIKAATNCVWKSTECLKWLCLSVTFSISMQIDEVFNSKDLGCRFRRCFFCLLSKK